MVEERKRDGAELRAQAKRARSLATGLVPGEDRRRLSELAASLEEEAEAADASGARRRSGAQESTERQAAE
jgi:alpha-L-fucosidase